MSWTKKKHFARRRYKLAGFGISVLLSLAVLSGYILSHPEFRFIRSTGMLDLIEAKTLDLRFRLRGKRSTGEEIVIIAMDEKTEDALGRWQSSGRRWIAKMLDILHTGGAKVIGFDLTLAEPDQGAAPEAVAEIKTRYLEEIPSNPHFLTYLDEVQTTYDYDRQLAEAIQRAGNVVLGVYHFFNQAEAAHLTPEKHAACRQLIHRVKYDNIRFPPGIAAQPLRLKHSFGVETNLPEFSAAAKSFGHFTVVPDVDGYIRQSSLLIEYQQAYCPSLDLEVARAYLQPRSSPIIHVSGQEGEGNVHAIQLGQLLIPTDLEGKLVINYYGPARTFPYYSLADVIQGVVPPATFQDKIVLFGFTSAVYQDVHSTPFQSKTYPGVEAHATLIANMLHQDFLIKPEWGIFFDSAVILALGILLGIVLLRVRTLAGACASLLCLVGVAGFVHLAFLFLNVWLNVTFPALFILLDYVVLTSYKYFAEEKQKRVITEAFQHYVAPTVVEQILEHGERLQLSEEEKVLTALFSDIRDFTTISEHMEPKALVAFLDEYFAAMTGIVLGYEGTIDKFIGDAIMVFYGAPIAQADHAVRACKTAVDMILRLEELHVRWKARGLPFLRIGVGINSGAMSVGNIGSTERFNYTVMGDNVNLASRLEGITKEYGARIVISQFTFDFIRRETFTVRELDVVRVKGKEKPVTIYELFGYDLLFQHKQPLVQMFGEGLHAYKARHWEQAITLFQEALRLDPEDQPSKMYIERCRTYSQRPPPDEWDGVCVIKTK